VAKRISNSACFEFPNVAYIIYCSVCIARTANSISRFRVLFTKSHSIFLLVVVVIFCVVSQLFLNITNKFIFHPYVACIRSEEMYVVYSAAFIILICSCFIQHWDPKSVRYIWICRILVSFFSICLWLNSSCKNIRALRAYRKWISNYRISTVFISTLTVDTVRLPKALVSVYKTTCRCYLEHQRRHLCCRKIWNLVRYCAFSFQPTVLKMKNEAYEITVSFVCLCSSIPYQLLNQIVDLYEIKMGGRALNVTSSPYF
jgi:hypothetical protein